MPRLKMLLDANRMGTGAETLDAEMRRRIIGQDEAVRQIVGIYQTHLAGMSAPGRPIGSLLFLGPTGSGKTRTVEALAEALVGDPRAVLKIDCAEYQHSHEIAKLIGSPPGYLGHRETHPALSQEAVNQFHTDKVQVSFVLFDEIEKASDALWNLLLGILDKGTLTLGDNKRVDFSKSIIFMTSNLGAAEMSALVRPKLGFGTSEPDRRLDEKMANAGVEAARRRFSPEFMNRIDRVVTFQPLGRIELHRILELELAGVRQRLARATGSNALTFTVSKAAREVLLTEGTDSRYGARHLKRAIERGLVQPISNLVATGQVAPGDRLIVECGRMGLVFLKEAAPVSVAAA